MFHRHLRDVQPRAMLGVSTGGRISELLSLTIGDVWQNRAAVTDLLSDKSIVKGGEVSRAVPVNKDSREAIENLIAWHRERCGNTEADRPLFPLAIIRGLSLYIVNLLTNCSRKRLSLRV